MYIDKNKQASLEGGMVRERLSAAAFRRSAFIVIGILSRLFR